MAPMICCPISRQRKQKDSKKKTVNKISVKTSNLSLPSSVTSLKIKERASLTGVPSKYGGRLGEPSNSILSDVIKGVLGTRAVVSIPARQGDT
ncbi:hypothetical protein COCNU_11G011790 [Cocos nucifera]|uniref:Uncharacterized protein n=1 Tax=Cocos nucifera TaxID=13894 RepID=A0A8K0IPS6_COCNU|nr:hypothetical protein COCNU_11G011790 [Cocos nucifera]